MKRLPTLDRALLAVLAPLWVVCFFLSVRAAAQGTGYPPLQISRPAADEYPAVVAFRSLPGGEHGDLRLGDRLRRVGEKDLRGAGPVDLAVVFARHRGGDRLAVVYERATRPAESSLTAASYRAYWPRLPASLVFAATAILLLLRATPSPLIRAIFASYICQAMLLACTFAGGRALTIFSIAVEGTSFSLAAAMGVRAALLFPLGTEPVGAWGRFGPWLFALIGPLDVSRFYGVPFPRQVGLYGTTIVGLLSTAVALVALRHNYVRSGPIQRRQIKWFLFGSYCALLVPLIVSMLATVWPSLEPLLVVAMSSLALIPIALVIAISRYNLFDIDRLISWTASYTILGVIALAALLAAVPRLAAGIGGPIGIEADTAQIALSLLLAAVIVPLQRILRPRVDQVLFADRFAVERGFEQLLADLSSCSRPQALTELAGLRLCSLFDPENLVLYTRGARTYAPALVLGRAAPVAHDASGPPIAVLRAHAGPVTSERAGRGGAEGNPFDRAAVETLGAAVVVPVRRDDDLIAFFCLGPKRSGDVYTSTDVAMLSAVADKISVELRQFDQAEVIRQGREMQDALRQYVPGAVAEELARGRDLEVGERELSVLFADIRNYSAYSERRAPQEVFAAVNRYTGAISEIVQQEGGSVVEFGGDGVMAVFGAPRELPDKERAAVAAAQRIVAAVARLGLGGREPLSVGVGVATGIAYVGNVRSADRFIWTAIGKTTNLASRLQALTRDLDASIIIDTVTRERAGEIARPFAQREKVAIRGHSESIDVFLLPRRAAA